MEILSPQQSEARVVANILCCLSSGTELGWLIDPEERLVISFRQGQQPEVKQGSDLLPGLSRLANWQLTAVELFELLSFR